MSKQQLHILIISKNLTVLWQKITQILNIYEKITYFRGKPSFTKRCNCCRRYGHNLAESRQKQQANLNRPLKYKKAKQIFKSLHEKSEDHNLPKKKTIKVIVAQDNHSQTTILIADYNPPTLQIDGRSPDRQKLQNYSQNRYNRPNS